jgi:hypothetical protein
MKCQIIKEDLPQCEIARDEIKYMLNKLWFSGRKGQLKCSKIRMNLIKKNDIIYNYNPNKGWYLF